MIKRDPAARIALASIVALTVVRLFLAATQGMFQDECYYWTWSRQLAASYVDQGPGIAFVIRAGTFFFGDTPLGVRFPSVVLAALTGWLTFLTARRWLGPKAALWVLLLLACAPLLAIGGFVATYDVPQVFCWAWALCLFTQLLHSGKPRLWYALGAVVMLGTLCKLTMLLFAPGVLLTLFLLPEQRRHLRTAHPYLAFALVLLAFVPMVLWNRAHGEIGWLHARGLSANVRGTLVTRLTGDFLGGQALAVGPLVWLAELWLLLRLWRRRALEPSAGFVLGMTLPTLMICLLSAARSKLEVNWPAPMHLTALMPVGVWLNELWERRTIEHRFGAIAVVALSLLMTLLGFFPMAFTAIGLKLPRQAGQKLSENWGWDRLVAVVQEARERAGADGRPVFVAGTNYRMNAVMSFHLPGQPQVQGLYLNTRRDQFYVWTDPQKLLGQNATLALEGSPEAIEAQVELARRYFGAVVPYSQLTLRRPGLPYPVKEWSVYICSDFRGYNPDSHATGY